MSTAKESDPQGRYRDELQSYAYDLANDLEMPALERRMRMLVKLTADKDRKGGLVARDYTARDALRILKAERFLVVARDSPDGVAEAAEWKQVEKRNRRYESDTKDDRASFRLNPGTTWEVEKELRNDPELATAVARLQVLRRARDVDAEQQALEADPEPVDLGSFDELIERRSPVVWRIEGLLGSAASLLLTAQRKTGKTTVLVNLIHSLLTGEPFLGRFATTAVAGSVLLLNYEVSGSQMVTWLESLIGGLPRIQRDRLWVMNLRGRENLLATERGRSQLIAHMIEHKVEALLVDVYGAAFFGESEQDNTAARAFLKVLDRVKTAGGAQELILSAHAGWANAERTRGASALEDWADSLAVLSKSERGDDETRYFAAHGRDVDVEKDALSYDPATRRLTLTGTGGPAAARKTAAIEALADPIVAIVEATPGTSAGSIEAELRKRGHSFRSGDHSAAIAALVAEGRIERAMQGARSFHYPPGKIPKVMRPVESPNKPSKKEKKK